MAWIWVGSAAVPEATAVVMSRGWLLRRACMDGVGEGARAVSRSLCSALVVGCGLWGGHEGIMKRRPELIMSCLSAIV